MTDEELKTVFYQLLNCWTEKKTMRILKWRAEITKILLSSWSAIWVFWKILILSLEDKMVSHYKIIKPNETHQLIFLHIRHNTIISNRWKYIWAWIGFASRRKLARIPVARKVKDLAFLEDMQNTKGVTLKYSKIC